MRSGDDDMIGFLRAGTAEKAFRELMRKFE
jgi:hypothetical protein